MTVSMLKIKICLVLSLLFVPLHAADYTYVGGRGYSEYRTCPNLAPGIALGVVALAAIIAVAVQNASNAHGHCNAHN